MQGRNDDRPAGDTAAEAVDSAIREGKAAAGRLADDVRGRLRSFANLKKDRAAGRLGGVADVLRDSGEDLAGETEQPWIGAYAEQAADALEDTADALQRKDIGELIGDLEDFAHRQPAVFIAGALLAGVLLGRFLKASGEREAARATPGGRPDA